MDTISTATKNNLFDFNDFTDYTAEQLGECETKCKFCNQPHKWRKATMLGREMHFQMSCQCEIDEEERLKDKIRNMENTKVLERYRNQSHLGIKSEEMTFDNWKHTQSTEQCYCKALRYANTFTLHSNGLCIYGNPGNGKTHLATALYNTISSKGGMVIFKNVPKLLEEIKATFNKENNSDESEASILSAMVNADLLILDDLGAEKPTEWVREKLYYIVNERYNYGRPLIITTNSSEMKGLEEIVGIRTYDRIVEMCIPVRNDGTSYRRQIAKQRLISEQ